VTDFSSELNTLFNPSLCMFYIDIMGNLLSNLKLAFYEYLDDKNFISRMIIEGNIKTAIINHAKAY
jgi:hypothetical protein